ncbi:dephospho-CoA kinase [Rhodanobacter sp. ANJX3]|uniref:dephospho-CoA kinase n=1 Tax=Rhodanobacter sp. ANJX3 TaxID=2723083 RepID=UPI00160CE6B5|nr:dephospho-CoA kinase [Rhodanobacter sp. ANJX3]MBB5360698.1 dephospho-CoA kinase [Rhodanobacter sp. ANJX3]
MTTNTLVIALTGGIAAGKSAVARRFEVLGVHVHDADLAAREVVDPGTPGLTAVAEAFGEGVLDETGTLDRRAMRERVFTDPAARRRLEAIIHPLVRDWLRDRVAAETGPYCLLAIPLLAENIGHYRWIKHVLLVDAPESLQFSRLMLRDGIDETLARNMLAQQASRAERLALADYVIDNSGDEAALDAAVAELHRKFLALAERHRTSQNMS